MLITRTELPNESRIVRLVSSAFAEEGRDYALYLNDHLCCIGDSGLEETLIELGIPFIPEMTERSTFPELFEDLVRTTDIDINCLATDEAAFLRLNGHYYTRRQAEHIYNALKAHF